MKKNTEKILLALFPAQNREWYLPLSSVYALVPQLSAGGKRSLIHLLKQDHSISTIQVGQQTHVYLDNPGKELLIRRFPALSERWQHWDGTWGCCVFVTAPQFDAQFRYLRQLLLAEGCFAVSRGVYFAPFPFSQVVMSELNDRYAPYTAVFTIAQWQFQREHSFVLRQLGIADVLQAYSGISEEIAQLLAKNNISAEATDQQKKLIHTVFDRFCESLGQDPGFAARYGPELLQPIRLFRSMQSLLERL